MLCFWQIELSSTLKIHLFRYWFYLLGKIRGSTLGSVLKDFFDIWITCFYLKWCSAIIKQDLRGLSHKSGFWGAWPGLELDSRPVLLPFSNSLGRARAEKTGRFRSICLNHYFFDPVRMKQFRWHRILKKWFVQGYRILQAELYSPQKIYWNPSLQDLRMWLYLKIGSLPM